MENGLRIGPLLLAAVVLGALALQDSFAADKGSTAEHAGPKVGKANAPRNLLGRGTLSPGASERVGQSACLPVIMRAFQDATADPTE